MVVASRACSAARKLLAPCRVRRGWSTPSSVHHSYRCLRERSRSITGYAGAGPGLGATAGRSARRFLGRDRPRDGPADGSRPTNLVLTGGPAVERGLMSHCLATTKVAERLGLPPEVRDPLGQVFRARTLRAYLT